MIWTCLVAIVSAQEDVADPYDPEPRPPFRLHDHISIIVSERAKALSSTDLATDRRGRLEVDLDDWIHFESAPGALPRMNAATFVQNPGIDLDGRYRQDNTGRTSRQFDLTFNIMAEVVDIRPNGVLVVEARKRRKVNGETETIRLSGEVHPDNVTVDRTAKSSSIVNLDIEYDGAGTVGDQAKPGFLGWLINKLWPF
jgi:flagellar L-ring protein precursor FlgH